MSTPLSNWNIGAGSDLRVAEDNNTLEYYGREAQDPKWNSVAPLFFVQTKTITSTDALLTLAVENWTRYIITCNKLKLSPIADGIQESELVVTFATSATEPDIGVPKDTIYIGNFPMFYAGETYVVNIRNGIVVVAETQKRV